jgi:hypothetical protein
MEWWSGGVVEWWSGGVVEWCTASSKGIKHAQVTDSQWIKNVAWLYSVRVQAFMYS